MKVVDTTIPDVKILEPQIMGDERGFFAEVWREEWAQLVGVVGGFKQDNVSGSRLGTLRGLHYQLKNPQGKLVRVSIGEVFDVAVDLRRSSPTFGKWVGEILSANNKRMMWIPPGFAHGFLVLSDWAEFAYKCTDYYAPEWERAVLWNDETIGIQWPVMEQFDLVLSEKDKKASIFSQCESYP